MDLAGFYNSCRNGKLLGPILTNSEYQGVDAIVSRAMKRNVPRSQLAYMLATAYHETAGTMQPIREIGSDSYLLRMYDITGTRPALAKAMGNTCFGDGITYCGRGMVQLTWKSNYARASKELGVDLVNNPTRAQELGIAADVMVVGMLQGWFTGAKVTRLPAGRDATLEEFISSRKIINGTDRATLIAGYALEFQRYLKEAGY